MDTNKLWISVFVGALTGAAISWWVAFKRYSNNNVELLPDHSQEDVNDKLPRKNKRSVNRLKHWQLHHHINGKN